MRLYEVRPGDSPAGIAARPDMAGCPKCAIDLLGANPHKPVIVYPNGFKTFRDLTVGERLNLPKKWFDGTLDARPPAYFAALPYSDGVTPSMLGDAATGILGDFAALDAAAASVSALVALTDPEFVNAVDAAGVLIDRSVAEAYGSSNAAAASNARDVGASVAWASQRAIEMAAALGVGDTTAASEARPEIQNVLLTAMNSARTALSALYGDATQPSVPSTDLTALAQAVATAISSDPNYCSSVSRAGSVTNAAVHAFKTAWNASGQSPVPINTGNYEQSVADALTKLLGSAPPGCAARAAPVPTPTPQPIAQTEAKRLSTGAIFGIGLVGAGAVGGVIYLATRHPPRRRRRR